MSIYHLTLHWSNNRGKAIEGKTGYSGYTHYIDITLQKNIIRAYNYHHYEIQSESNYQYLILWRTRMSCYRKGKRYQNQWEFDYRRNNLSSDTNWLTYMQRYVQRRTAHSYYLILYSYVTREKDVITIDSRYSIREIMRYWSFLARHSRRKVNFTSNSVKDSKRGMSGTSDNVCQSEGIVRYKSWYYQYMSLKSGKGNRENESRENKWSKGNAGYCRGSL